MKLRNLIQAILKNKEIVKHHRISWLTCIFLFVMSIFLATIPYYVNAFSPTDYAQYFPQIGPSLVAFMEANDCEIAGGLLQCSKGESKQVFGGYAFELLGNQTVAEPNTLYFQTQMFVLDSGDGTVIQGDYSNLGTFAFQEVQAMLVEGGLTEQEFANVILKNIELSAVSLNMMTITMTFLFQYAFFTLVLAYLFKFAKGKRDHWPYSMGDHGKMIVLSMVLPAFIGAIFALYVPAMASLIFPFAYVIRVVFLYMRLARHTQ